MLYRPRMIGTALALVVLLAGSAAAQTNRPHLGPRLSYQFELEEVGLGAQFSAPLGSHLEFYPSIDVFFTDPNSAWSFNVDLKYRVGAQSSAWFYLGGGLNILDTDASDSEAGMNLFLGAESLKGNVHPFGELRFIVSDNSSAQLAAGLNFTLGHH